MAPSRSAAPLTPPPPSADLDVAPIRRAPWLTPRRLMLFVIGWLMLFAVVSVFVSNPFQAETSASATPNYATVMFLHGLLVGMVGLLALVTCHILGLRSMQVRGWIAGGVVFATVLSMVGGLFDTRLHGNEIALWVHIFGYFALDLILIVLLIGLIGARWTSRARPSLTYLGAFLATLAMFGAALMGHLAGWIMDFGWNTPPLLKDFGAFAGYGTEDDWTGALVGSHSHEMVVGVMALIILLVAQQFGYSAVQGLGYVLTRVGAAMVSAGIVVMAAMYIYAGFSSWAPPAWFTSGAGGANGIASDDVITGILVMGGGLVLLAGLALGRTSLVREPIGLAALWTWTLSFATVVIAGYAIEMNEVYFGAGDPHAAGAANDAVYTWLHQDLGLFLLPALTLVMLAIERLVVTQRPNWIGWTVIGGTSLAFIGSMIYVFVTPALYGAGYVFVTIGLLVIGVALLATVWWGITGALRSRVAATQQRPLPPVEADGHATPLKRTAPLRPLQPTQPTTGLPRSPESPESPASSETRTPVAPR